MYFCTEFEFELMTNAKFSFYLPPHFFYLDEDGTKHFASKTPTKSVTVQELFDYIKNDPAAAKMTDTFRSLPDADAIVTNYRPEKDENGNWQAVEAGTVAKAKQFKNTRFCFVQATGIFTSRSAEFLQTPSGLWCVDFDHFAETSEELAQAKDALLSDDKARPVLVFTSPSGDGLKAFYLFDYIDDAEEREARLRGLYAYLRSKHTDWKKLEDGTHALDKYTDFGHCCNVPHDPDARLCLDAFTRLDWNVWRVEREKQTASSFVATNTDGAKAKYYADELLRAGIDLTANMTFQEYVGLAHAFTGLTGGEELFQQVSSLWPNYSEANTRTIWKLAERQSSRADLTHFFKLAISAGIVLFENSGLPEAEAANKARHEEFLASPAGEAWKAQKDKERQTRKQMTENKKTATTGTTPETKSADAAKTDDAALTEQELFEIVCKKRDFGDMIHEAAKIAVNIPTKYVFGKKSMKEPFTLKSQALTVIGAGTSHGKTRFLENIILRVAKHEDEDISGTSLFFTLEESLADILTELVNIDAGVREVRHEEDTNNFTAYFDTFRRMDDPENGKKYFPDDAEFEAAKASVLSFRDKYTETDRLRIIDDERFRDVDVLCRTLRAFVESGQKLKAVFLDHLGMMTTKDPELSKVAPKTERVENIVTKLEKLAQELNIPFVLTQQLSRQAAGALSLECENLADSADVERSANTVVLLWNSVVLPSGNSEKDLTKADGLVYSSRKLQESGFFYGISGALFAKLAKRRGGKRGVWTVFDFDGGTGQIKDMTPERAAELKRRFEEKKDEVAVANLKDGESHTNADGTTTTAQRNKKGVLLHITDTASSGTDDKAKVKISQKPVVTAPVPEYVEATPENVQNFQNYYNEQSERAESSTTDEQDENEKVPF